MTARARMAHCFAQKKRNCFATVPYLSVSSATRIRTWKMLESESSALPFGDSALDNTGIIWQKEGFVKPFFIFAVLSGGRLQIDFMGRRIAHAASVYRRMLRDHDSLCMETGWTRILKA